MANTLPARSLVVSFLRSSACAAEPSPNPRRRFLKDQSGVAAVEFALILPFMLMIYLGLVEVSRGLRAAYKVEQMARAMAELTAQKLTGGENVGQAGVTDVDLNLIFATANALLRPLPGNAELAISEIKITPKAGGGFSARVQWSSANRLSMRRPCETDLTGSASYAPGNIAQGYLTGNPPSFIIVADVSYTYSPGLNFELFKWSRGPTWTIRQTAYSPVRNSYDPPHIQARMTQEQNDEGTNCNYPNK